MNTSLSTLRIFSVVISFVIFGSSTAQAQKNDPPVQQFGLGAYAINSSTIPSGLEAVYAFNPSVQVGSEISLALTNTGSMSTTKLFFGPFARYLFPSSVSPFVQGGLQLPTWAGTNPGVFLGLGLAYNINHEIGLHTSVDILNIVFSNPSVTTVGWSIIRADADWFF